MNAHERGFVDSLVRSSRRERISLLLNNAKKRSNFTNEFAHNGTSFLDPNGLRTIPPNQQHAKSICALLIQMGAPETCPVISEGALDGKEMPLLSALSDIVGGGMGSVISCVPGRLGYFEGEVRERYILQK
jgi:hypothetical protein